MRLEKRIVKNERWVRPQKINEHMLEFQQVLKHNWQPFIYIILHCVHVACINSSVCFFNIIQTLSVGTPLKICTLKLEL